MILQTSRSLHCPFLRPPRRASQISRQAASSNWRGLQPSSKHLTCEREAVELATKALAAALPEAHHQSGGRLQEFVEMAFAWRYRSLLVTSGFLDLEGQPEMATSPAGGGVK